MFCSAKKKTMTCTVIKWFLTCECTMRRNLMHITLMNLQNDKKKLHCHDHTLHSHHYIIDAFSSLNIHKNGSNIICRHLQMFAQRENSIAMSLFYFDSTDQWNGSQLSEGIL